jgi:hypothetical protein
VVQGEKGLRREASGSLRHTESSEINPAGEHGALRYPEERAAAPVGPFTLTSSPLLGRPIGRLLLRDGVRAARQLRSEHAMASWENRDRRVILDRLGSSQGQQIARECRGHLVHVAAAKPIQLYAVDAA